MLWILAAALPLLGAVDPAQARAPRVSSLLEARAAMQALQQSAQEERARTALVEEVLAAVDRGAGPPRDPLARLGAPAAAAAFELAVLGGVPAAWTPEGRGFVRLDPEWITAIDDALLALPREPLRGLLHRVAALEPRPFARLHALDLVGRFGIARDVRLAVELATPLAAGGEREPRDLPLPRAQRLAFGRTLAAILDRDRVAFARLEETYDGAPHALQGAIADTLAERSGEPELSLLASLLGRTPALDAHLLTALARAAAGAPRPVSHDVLEGVGDRLGSRDPAVLRAAVRAAGALESYAAIPILLELADDPDRATRIAALQALRDATGLRLGDERGPWERWYARERRWWDEERPLLLHDLRNGDGEQALAALRALASHRLERHVLAVQVQDALGRSEAPVVELACHALRELGSPTAVPGLIRALEHPSGVVRRAAWRALRGITGLDLPPDAALWRSTTS